MSFEYKYLKYKNKYLSLKNNMIFTQYGGAGMESLSMWTEIKPDQFKFFMDTSQTPMLDKNSKILSRGDTVILPSIEGCVYSIGILKEGLGRNMCRIETADGKIYRGPCSDLESYKSSFTLKNADYNYGSPDSLDIKTKDRDSKEISIGSNVLLPHNTPGSQYRWGKLYGTRNNGKICIVRTQDGKIFWGPCSELQS